jgi:hypothetical protein
MSDDDDYVFEADVLSAAPTDPIAQRALAFVVVSKFAGTTEDETLRGLSILMMKKIILSIDVKKMGIVVPFPQKEN